MQIVYQTQNSNIPSIQTAATAIASNPSRIGFSIQNVGTNALFVLLGSGASSSVFHVVLKGGSAINDGLGGVLIQDEGSVYTGIITTSGTSPTYTVLEMSP